MADIPGNSSTTATISVGGTISGNLEAIGDHDWFRISLTDGQSISVSLDGITLEDSYLRIYDRNGNLVYENDDISAGIERDSLLAFTADYTGTYYIDVGAWDEGYTGSYQLSVSSYTPPPVGTIGQLAEQLTSAYWGGESQRFNVTQGGTITVNLTGLTPEGRSLAIAALGTWTNIIGVTFTPVTVGGQIIFDDEEEGAWAESSVSNGFISLSQINVSSDWIMAYGTGLNTYSFQTYIHEVGHALGLGHQGNYNGDARYPFDALYQNDAWPMSVMSYFSQTDSSYFANQGFDENYLLTPMMADILAMSTLYGLSTTFASGDNTYTFSGAGSGAQCIYDAGGTDWIYCPSYAGNQLINLNPGTFSNINGDVGNVSIALNVIIENALGGSGNDTIIGNSANNWLQGGAGNDTITGGTGNDILEGGSGADVLDGGAGDDRITYDVADNAAQVTGGTGTDTLIVNGGVAPTGFNLGGQGFERAEVNATDAGANAWTSITKYYHGSWTLLQQVTINDNGSRLVVDYDYNNSLATSQVESGYDALGRLSSVDQLFDNNSRTFINLDEASTQSWTQDWFQFDAQGRLSSEDVIYDDGTRTFINLDEGNVHGWSQDWFAYDAQGRLSSEDIRFDNGSRTFINIDQDNSQSWKSAWFTYDNQGRLDTQDVNYDDGSRIFYNYDQAGTESFQLMAILFNSLGVAYQQITTWDDGTTTYTMI